MRYLHIKIVVSFIGLFCNKVESKVITNSNISASSLSCWLCKEEEGHRFIIVFINNLSTDRFVTYDE